MVYAFLSETSKARCKGIEDAYGVNEVFDRKIFRASHTEITYRMINYLDKDNLLGDVSRSTSKGWRKFSLSEIVFMYLLIELKDFGFNQITLKPLVNTLMHPPAKSPNAKLLNNAISLCLTGVEINLAFFKDGTMALFDPGFYGLFIRGEVLQELGAKTHLKIRFNDVVDRITTQLSGKAADVKYSAALDYLQLLKAQGESSVSPKEQKVIDALRNQDYLSVEVRKKDGDLHIMKVDRLEEFVSDQEQVAKLIMDKGYADIRLIKRDGKVVRLETKDTIKL